MPTNPGNYDAPQVTVRRFIQPRGGVGAGTATPGAILPIPVNMDVWNAHYRITAAGTGATAALRLVTVSGTTTTTVGTGTVGTAAINTVAPLLSTATNITPTLIAAGGRVYCETINDATLAADILFEVVPDPETSVLS